VRVGTRNAGRTAWKLSACIAALALIALAADRWMHVSGVPPYLLLLLACSLMHLMHSGRRPHSDHIRSGDRGPRTVSSPETPRAGGHQ
jgi:hypothetical protein